MKMTKMKRRLLAAVSAMALIMGTVPAYAGTFTSDGNTTIPVNITAEVSGTYEVQLPASLTATLVKANDGSYKFLNPENGSSTLGAGSITMTDFSKNHGIAYNFNMESRLQKDGVGVVRGGADADDYKIGLYMNTSKDYTNQMVAFQSPDSTYYNDDTNQAAIESTLASLMYAIRYSDETYKGSIVGATDTAEANVKTGTIQIKDMFVGQISDGSELVTPYTGSTINSNGAYTCNLEVSWKRVVLPSTYYNP